MLRIRTVVVSLALLLTLTFAERVRYDNHRIYQVNPLTPTHLVRLTELETTTDRYRYLGAVTTIEKTLNIVVAPQNNSDFLNYLDLYGIPHKIVEENFQRILDVEQQELRARSAKYDWTGYHTLEENYNWLQSLPEEFPDIVQTIVAGKSYEGRDILGVKMSFKPGNKGVFIEGGIHAREWISPATVTYIVNELLTSKDPEVREMAEKYDWYVFPHVNPDGYVYTHERDRLWRKTRSRGTFCYGADPNRNWDFNWLTTGASSNECSETFAGKSAFSEIEMKSLSDYVASLKGKLHTYLAFHSYSQLMLYPYGHTAEPVSNDNDLAEIAKAATTALSKRYGTKYTYGSTYLAIYPAAGASIDWAYGVQGIPIAYVYELRPASSINGFILPSAQIIPTGEETLDSLVALTKKAAELQYL